MLTEEGYGSSLTHARNMRELELVSVRPVGRNMGADSPGSPGSTRAEGPTSPHFGPGQSPPQPSPVSPLDTSSKAGSGGTPGGATDDAVARRVVNLLQNTMRRKRTDHPTGAGGTAGASHSSASGAGNASSSSPAGPSKLLSVVSKVMGGGGEAARPKAAAAAAAAFSALTPRKR